MKTDIKNIITNKYVIATAVFISLLIFGERNSIYDQYKLRKQLNKAQLEHDYYKNEIEKVRQEQEELFGSDEKLEKFAREKYLMKRDSEDIFVIIDKSKKVE